MKHIRRWGRDALVIKTRIPSRLERAMQGFVVLLIGLSAVDFIDAFSAKACFKPDAGPKCFPWGMTEGPMEGYSWGYASRENYLINSASDIAILIVAALVPFVAYGKWTGLIGIGGVVVLGSLFSAHVLGMN